MLPAHIARNIRDQVRFYLQSTFSFRDPAVERAFQDFIEDPEQGLFKGPWVQLRRPFRPAPPNVETPFGFTASFHPFVHQWRAWMRLHSRGQQPKPTIVTTGTGSGKTECFLFPVLDHCLRMRQAGQKGIKAIVLYPMNALAADQEKRFAKEIWRQPVLKGHGIRVGTYTGRYDPSDPGTSAASGTTKMGKDHGITNHAALQEEPPDILLTNYRMLDFLLMRPQDQALWRFNEPGVFQYLVLDELHTYDGAQGSDVACLIRRLKARLGAAMGDLCVVGTSATLDERSAVLDREDNPDIDKRETGRDRLAKFASKLFEEEIDPDAVIEEDRLHVAEIVYQHLDDTELPAPGSCEPEGHESALGYTLRQAALWGAPAQEEALHSEEAEQTWRIALGAWLRRSSFFKTLLSVFEAAELRGETPLVWDDLLERLTRAEVLLQQIGSVREQEIVLASFLALVAHGMDERDGHAFPLAPTQVQVWLRELRRLGRTVESKPRFAWMDEPLGELKCLPTFHCSECGESGWVALHDPGRDVAINHRGVDGKQLKHEATEIYNAWFGYRGGKDEGGADRDPRLHVISPWPESAAGPAQTEMGFKHDYLCEGSLVLRKGDGPCPLTGDGRRFRVKVNNETRKNKKEETVGNQGCSNCGSTEGLFFVGSRAATLSSVAIDELFGSRLNNDPKLLAFTDSVQDASHRAGYFTARTFRFTFRTALQHVIDAAGVEGLPLVEVGSRLFDFWSAEAELKTEKHVLEALMPPDLQQYPEYVEFRNNAMTIAPPPDLRKDVEQRWVWEATSEFGLMQTHGRTMEPSGAAALGWRMDRVEAAVSAMRERLAGISPVLGNCTAEQVRLWILGFLYRYRTRGAIDHPYMQSYAQNNFWGKYPFGRAVPGRETYPSASHYKPKLLVTEPAREHEFVLAPLRSSRIPWHQIWTRRALGLPNLDETSVLDALRKLLAVSVDAGLLARVHRNGLCEYLAIAADACVLHRDVVHYLCRETERSLVRPALEASVWEGAPSLEYYADSGRYAPAPFNVRQAYYQDRYRKGALRRVMAQEHTGLLKTTDREDLERNFSGALHEDDPNILTCTSTLEMGIDIGDLSSTMLCSIPPNTASYLQRIGRAGRATGTALIVSIVNQQPHDLFFYARPVEMLKGKVEPPGCWLDASAVLARQYLGYCFDTGTANGELPELPRTGRQMVDDLANPEGLLPRLFEWVTLNEAELQGAFLDRFSAEFVHKDTRERFVRETVTELLKNRMEKAVSDFDRARRDLENARKRLNTQLEELGAEEVEARREIEQEMRLLRGRLASHNHVTSLELLTDYGLLPNYAFPERGVRFHGAVYNRYRRNQEEHKPVEITRGARPALRELAPGNTFYTHSRQFEIQQIAIGNAQQTLIEAWAVCGLCGHMRLVEELQRPEAHPACPQCGHEGDNLGQNDLGQQKRFLEYPRSQALSFMEHYESMSGDRNEERQQERYSLLSTFDHTIEEPSGAVGEDGLPFGIEYRAAMVMREINVGFAGRKGSVYFGAGQVAPEEGFAVCADCGVVVKANGLKEKVEHRRSCIGRRKAEKQKQEGKAVTGYRWESAYLYRELRSEAIRLLLPLASEEDLGTLKACVYLGLRLRFEGNPAHLLIESQMLPTGQRDVNRHYLVLMDAVPGGTGFLKTLYQETDGLNRMGEGIMDVLRRALAALETCPCGALALREEDHDSDGCYRCIRTFHLRYVADQISRRRGIQLLTQLIDAGERRVEKATLEEIKVDSLYGSVLERRFVDRLKALAEENFGVWEPTIVRGNRGFRFSLKDGGPLWDLELQPTIGQAQGVAVASQPDFMLTCDSLDVKPILVFTDGYEFHCHPNNRLADDLLKRNAILESGRYRLWNVTWDDLAENSLDTVVVAPGPMVELTRQYVAAFNAASPCSLRDVGPLFKSGFEQLTAFLGDPVEHAWSAAARFSLIHPLRMLSEKRTVPESALMAFVTEWLRNAAATRPGHTAGEQWLYNDRVTSTNDFLSWAPLGSVLADRKDVIRLLACIDCREEVVSLPEFKQRWRIFMTALNIYQFACTPNLFVFGGDEPPPETLFIEAEPTELPTAWRAVLELTIGSLHELIRTLAGHKMPLPEVEYYDDALPEEACAELAWVKSTPPVAVLSSEQVEFAQKWRDAGWKVFDAASVSDNEFEGLLAALRGKE